MQRTYAETLMMLFWLDRVVMPLFQKTLNAQYGLHFCPRHGLERIK